MPRRLAGPAPTGRLVLFSEWRTALRVQQQKLEAQIKRIIGTVLARDISDPRLGGLVSVTRVRLTPDAREASVFVSVLSSLPTSTIRHGLKAAESLMQRRVARGLNRRVAPRLRLHLDESLKRQGEVLRLLGNVAGTDRPPPGFPED